MKRKIEDYTPIPGFLDLREFVIPKTEFLKLWNMQRYLSKCEENREEGKYKDSPDELDKIRRLSAEYQQALFSYPKYL
ncbi:MAG TPA: hypothetical protein DDW85_02445 [Porphyromonadaceae bacterium]|nr:hypothetical protein [Porphyromonadaceae bacterium]